MIPILMPLDTGITAGAVILFLTLLPTALNKLAQVPRWKSSVPITSVLFFYAYMFASYSLWLSALTVTMQATAWLMIAIFRPVRSQLEVNLSAPEKSKGVTKKNVAQAATRAFEFAKAREHERLMDHQRYGAATNTYFPEFKPLDCTEIHQGKTHDDWIVEKQREEIMNSGPDGPL